MTRDIEAFRSYWSCLAGGRRPPDSEDITDADPEEVKMAADFGDAFFQASDQRRVFRTDDGRLGIGPKVMDTGDIIVILYGCRSAFVLRPHIYAFRMVDDCYLPRIM
ncbi:hypothetical protein AC579_7143 [Pseudocercospora musae]|uniref:Uncharacterized protein n=1 Tax=Pseudocercospora musae TaxID=113226 RepID=A0A139INH9_9PEZI|nr:hypothetical protein AC579_7143 [Pseudocercospora musae]